MIAKRFVRLVETLYKRRVIVRDLVTTFRDFAGASFRTGRYANTFQSAEGLAENTAY